jgi:hypothetical protein
VSTKPTHASRLCMPLAQIFHPKAKPGRLNNMARRAKGIGVDVVYRVLMKGRAKLALHDVRQARWLSQAEDAVAGR